jgi:hypothetical protein
MSRSISHKHPEIIYIKKEQEGNETYFVASEDTADLAEMNTAVLVSIYKLVSTHTLLTKPILQPGITHHGSAPDHVRLSETD